MRRQLQIVGGLFGLGTLVGAVLTYLILSQQPPPAFSQAELKAMAELPFGMAFPTYLPDDAQRLAIRCDKGDAGAPQGCLLEYASARGCFAVWSGRGAPPLAGQGPARPVYNSSLGQAQLYSAPTLVSAPLRAADGSLFALLGREAVEARFECPRSLEPEEAARVLASLRRIGAPTTTLPPANAFE